MIRKLKTSGVVLAAVLVLGAAMAPAASAQVGKIIADGPVTLIGTQTGAASQNTLTAFGGTTTCASAKFTGHKYNETPHKAAPSGESTFTITPHYGVCSAKIGAASFPTTVDMNGCDYVLHLEAATGEDEYGVKTGVGCPVGQHITITIFATAAKHTAGEPFCNETITEKAEPYPGLKAKDTTNGFIDVSGKIEGISADKKSPTGSILCPEETTAAASLTQDLTLEGKNEDGESTPISFVNVISPGKIIADGPVTLIGTQTGEASQNQLTAFGGTTTCASAKFTGHKYNETPHKVIPSGKSTFTITPHYGVCSSKIGAASFPTTFDMNGCDYVLHLEAAAGEDEFAAKTGVSCPVGQHIVITIFATAAKHTANEPFCNETITEKAEPYPGLKAKDTTHGFIDVSGKIEGISADKESPTGSILCPKETTSTATLTQDTTFEGKNENGESTPISFVNVITPPNGKITADGPVTLIGTQTGAASQNTLTAFGGTTTCASAKFTGHKYNETPHKAVPSGSSTFTITPHYGVCLSSIGAASFPTTVDMNGCDYVLHLEAATGEDEYGVKTTAICPVGQHITITIFATAAKHSASEPFCNETITENPTDYTGLKAKDTTNGFIDVSGKIEGISADKESPTGSILCPKETTAAASLTQDVTLEGKNESGDATPISFINVITNGTITADGPVTFIGTQTGEASQNQLTAFGGTTQCASAIYTGHKYSETPHKVIPSGKSTFTITPHYGVCSSKIGAASFPTTVDMNGCDYVLHLEAATGEDEYATKTGVNCPVGQHILITIFATAAKHTASEPFCNETITENPAGYTGPKAKDTTNGFIDVSGTISGISVDKESPTGSILCPKETTSTATLTQDTTLEGKNEAGGTTSISLSHL